LSFAPLLSSKPKSFMKVNNKKKAAKTSILTLKSENS
jgi:hypothetical protein